MADRIASVSRFRAEGLRLSWPLMARRMLDQAQQWHVRVDDEEFKRVSSRGTEIALRWATSQLLGVPPGPFTVWTRKTSSTSPDRPVGIGYHPLGRLLTWSGEASTLELSATVADTAAPVVLLGFRGTLSPATAVASTTMSAATGANVTLLLHSTGMTSALVAGADEVSATVDHLADVVSADDWREWEIVGLPVGEGPEGSVLDLAGYDDRPQGMVGALTSPAEAGVQRLERGGPPAGWWPVTETGHLAPNWAPPDPKALLSIARQLLPELAELYTVPSPQQGAFATSRTMPPPQQDGLPLGQVSTASVGPLGALMLPSTTDPFYALALGFGTGYGLTGDAEFLSAMDFLVTADYPETPEGGPATYATYIPAPVPHTATAAVTGLAAGRDGLVRPAAPDRPWRETIRIGWDAASSSAALGRPTGFSLLRFDPSAGSATECLLERRTTQDWLPRVPSRAPGATGGPPSSRNVTVDPGQEIPLGSGWHSVGYAVAVEDVFGIWSAWEDAVATTPEPGPPLPRILSARLDPSYVGGTSCPATLALEVSLDWSDRTVSSLDVSTLLFPAPTTATGPPVGSAPGTPAAVSVSVTFAGDVPSGAGGVTVVPLDSTGTVEVAAGPAQTQEGRRYALTIPLPSLDYSAVRHWGAAVWVRTSLTVLGIGPWAPVDPALAYAASPVPPALPLPPPLPGVPVGSTPDARGCSHVQVVWGSPSGLVDHFAVYEVAETALRSVLAPGDLPELPASAPPGARLAQLKTAYDTLLSANQRRSIFRRLRQPDAAERSCDVTLPQGSTDIHLFVVIAVGPGSVESPWPQTSDALQAFRAPTVLAPAPPVLRSAFVDVGGATQLALSVEAASALPVTSFRLFRTTLVEASRAAETMGPAFAEVPAVDSGDPVSPTGTRRYVGSWQGAPVTGWRPSRFRAVAIPVPSLPIDAVVGLPSPGSPVLPVTVPPATPPDLDALVAEDWDGTGVVVRTATSVPLWRPELGPLLLRASASAAGVPLFPEMMATLDSLGEFPGSGVAGAAAPAGADPGPLVVRDVRSSERAPLSLWFRRPAVTDEVEVTVRLADPLGRATARTMTVAAEVIAVPPTLEVLGTTVVPGRGVAVAFRSDAPVEALPGGSSVLQIVAGRPIVGLHRFPPAPMPVSLVVPVPEIPSQTTFPLPPGVPIVVIRRTDATPYEYATLVRLLPPARITLTMTAPTGAATSVPLAVT